MTTATLKFTTTRLNQCTCPIDKPYVIYWDEAVKGLGLKIYPSTKKSFLFQSRLGNKVLKISIGTFPACTIDQARQKAKELDVMCLNGIDPRLEKKKLIAKNEHETRENKRKKLIFNDIWEAYLIANKSRWSDMC